MNTIKTIFLQKEMQTRIFIGWFLVFIIAFSNIGSFAVHFQMDTDKIENLAEGEKDIDMEEKEKNAEVEEDSFVNTHYDRFNSHQARLYDSQYLGHLDIYHLKIPTPPPDVRL